MTPKMDFSKSSKEFSKTLRRYADLSSKGAAEAINKKAKDVCIRAIKETPEADKAGIESSLRAMGTVGKPGPLVYKLLNKANLKIFTQGIFSQIISGRAKSAGN